ncbi:MAG: hypothetical protein WBE37_11700, partial [Bryobacteraceae bacterium]
ATAASKVPGLFIKDTGFTVTCRLPGKPPAAGFTLSHGVPVLVIAWAVKFVILELELESEIVCEVGVVLPGAKTKLSEFGLPESGLGAPVEFAFKVTGMGRFVVPEIILIKPISTPLLGAPEPMETVRTAGVLVLEEVTVNHPESE